MRIMSLTFLALLAAMLSGCQDAGLDLSANASRVVVGAQTPVAIDSLDGLPDSVAPRFSAALASAAQARDIRFVDAAGGPRFRLRGYLSAYPAEGGTALAWVWDVYDSTLKRARRVSGQHPVRAAGTDPWGGIDESALRIAAARSLDEIGRFLIDSGRPDAMPVAAAPAPARASSDQ